MLSGYSRPRSPASVSIHTGSPGTAPPRSGSGHLCGAGGPETHSQGPVGATPGGDHRCGRDRGHT